MTTYSICLSLEKADYKTKTMKRDKEGAYIMIKGLFQQEYIIVSIYVTNIGASKYIKQISTDIKGEIDRHNNSRGL